MGTPQPDLMIEPDLGRSTPAIATRGRRSIVPVADITNAFASVFAAVAIALITAYLMVGEVRPWLGARNGLVAWMSTATLVFAVGACTWAYRRSTTDSRFPMVLPLTAVLMLGQEIRFGADALGFAPPTVSGIEVGSLVDVREVVSLNAERLGLGFPTGVLVLILVIGATVVWAARARRWADGRVLVTEARVVMWLVASIGIALTVPFLGLFGEGTGAWFVTKMAGLASAGFLVVAGLAAGDHRRTVAGWRRRIWPWISDTTPRLGIPLDHHS